MNEANFNVVVDWGTHYANDCGEMTETQLWAFLRNRPLVVPVGDVFAGLYKKDSGVVEFQTTSGVQSRVRIQKVAHEVSSN